MKNWAKCLMAGATLFLLPVIAKAESGLIYECDADFTGAKGYKGRGVKPSAVYFQIIEGASVVPAQDPLTYRRKKIASASQKVGSDGVIKLSWNFDIPTTAGANYYVNGKFRIAFDPKTMSGTIRSSTPTNLTNGGTLDGVLSCKTVKAFPKQP